MRYHTYQNVYHQNDNTSSFGKDVKGTLMHCGWKCKLAQPLWKTAWRLLKNLKVELSYDHPFHFWVYCLVSKSSLTLCDPVDCSTPGFPVLHHLPEFVQTHVHWEWCNPTIHLSSLFPAFNLSQNHGLFQWVSHIRWPKYWSFSISLSNEYFGLISFRIYWFDLHVVQGTLKSLLQHHSSKASVLQCSAFFMAQRSHPYITTGKTIAFTIQNFAAK